MEISRRNPMVPSPMGSQDLEPRRRRRRRDGRYRVLPEGKPPRRVRRVVVALVLLGAAAVLAVPIALWASYRMAYVVSRNAIVKGSMTNVGAQIQGVVTSVEADAGQRVQAGQILARFEDRQLQASVLRAESRLAEAVARAASARARIAAARSETEDAKARHEQFASLASRGVIAQNDLRTSQTKRQTAEAFERTAIADYNAAQAEAAAARAELTLAKADLGASLIRAPADGRVVRRIAEPGASVVVGQPIVALWIGKEVWVEAWVDEDQLSHVAVGNEVRVTIKSNANRDFSGVVEAIGVSTDFELPDTAVPQPRNARMRTTPVVGVRIRLDQTEGLFPGLSAVVGIRKKAPE
ncbi:MAG TPA: HlyD family efflux transporter periplasmic adaptor subunit [Candidatus Limnocylindria bacterium]|nr:HlyD family efflux transporter periplasmic adaptor subunit [Candidatus Limnocylindria bacterium]